MFTNTGKNASGESVDIPFGNSETKELWLII